MKNCLRRLGALTAVVAMLALAPCAAADPDDGSPAPVADATTLSLADLGATDTIWFDARRDITVSTFSFIVPPGLTPETLNTTLEIPVELQYGHITATQDGKTLSRMPLPLKDEAQLVIPLKGAKATNNWAAVTLTVTALPLDRYCWDPLAPIRLVNSSISFSGNRTPPKNVASFLPPTLSKLSIAVPPKPSRAESETAIQLAAAMAARYGWMNTNISVVPIADGPGDPRIAGDRQIVVKENPDKGATLQAGKSVPTLLISGPGDELANQARLLSDPTLPFALSTKAVSGPLPIEQKPVGDSTTLDKMNLNGLSAESSRPEVNIKIDPTLFAQPLAGIRVHLLGSHTPLAENFNGEVLVWAGDELLDRWPVNAEGTIDHWIDVPDMDVRRPTFLKVRMHTTGDPGHCNDYMNPELRINGDTEIQANRASPPLPPGFRSLPQALLPRVTIGIGNDALHDTMRAAKIVVGLQRNSAIPMLTKVASLQEAISSTDPAILISPDGWTDQAIALPFSADQGKVTIGTIDAGGTYTNLTLDPAIKFGSLQTMFDGHRSVLIATSTGAPAQLDDLLRWLDAKPERWADLDGRAAIQVPGSAPVTVPNRRTDTPTEDQTPRRSQQGTGNWVWLAAAAVAAVALIGALMILVRTRGGAAEDVEDLAAGDEATTNRVLPGDPLSEVKGDAPTGVTDTVLDRDRPDEQGNTTG